MGTIIKVVCMYCKADMGEKDGEGVEGVSHGICPKCLLEHAPNVYQAMYGDVEVKKAGEVSTLMLRLVGKEEK